MNDVAVILKRFDEPDEVRMLKKGKFEIVRLAGMTIGRATYEPGWKWSNDVGPDLGQERCSVEHVGMVISGTATAAFAGGQVVELTAGNLFYIPPVPHDSWVVGDEPYVSLHFLGAEKYAAKDLDWRAGAIPAQGPPGTGANPASNPNQGGKPS